MRRARGRAGALLDTVAPASILGQAELGGQRRRSPAPILFLNCTGRKLLALMAVAPVLSGCSFDWEKPDLRTPAPDSFLEAKPQPAPRLEGGRKFAARFGSRELTGLVEQVLDHNLDLEAATARLQAADAQAQAASSALWPALNLGGGASRTLTPADAPLDGEPLSAPSRWNLVSLGLSANYEIDFWRKNESASKAARLQVEASRFDKAVVEIAAVSAVLNSYFQLVSAQERLQIARANVGIASSVLEAIRVKLATGAATLLDYSQQQAVVATQRATLPPLEQAVRQTKYRLAVLIGRTPESLAIRGGALSKLRFPRIAPGLPSQALLGRPDLAEAEAELAAKEFSVLAARAAMFPSIQLTGQYGLQSVALRNLLRPEAIGWEVASQLTQPLFDGGRLQGEFDAQKNRYAELAALYRKQILTALSEVESALAAVAESSHQLSVQAEAVVAARRAFDVAEARVHEGLIDIFTLSTTQSTLFQNRDLLEQARLRRFQAAATLFQALGGGWSPTTRDAETGHADIAYAGEAQAGADREAAH